MTEAPAKALDLGEVARRLANIVRAGTVTDVDLERARARVGYATGGDGRPVRTGWLPWIGSAAGEDRDWRPPSLGEQVVLLSPFGELSAAWILPGSYRNDDFPAPESVGTKRVALHRDGARIEYDSGAHELKAVLPAGGTASIQAPGGLTVTGDTDVDGDVSIDGGLTVTGTVEADGKISSKAEIEDLKGSMEEMRTTYNAHVHGVAPGPVTPPVAPASRMT